MLGFVRNKSVHQVVVNGGEVWSVCTLLQAQVREMESVYEKVYVRKFVCVFLRATRFEERTVFFRY